MICVCVVSCSRNHQLAALTYDDRGTGRERLHAIVEKMIHDLTQEGTLPHGRCPGCGSREFRTRLEVTPFDTPQQAAECIAMIRDALHEVSAIAFGQRQRKDTLH